MAKAKYTKGKDGYWQTKVWNGEYTDTGKKKRITLRSDKSSKDLENKVIAHNQALKERKYVRQSEYTFLEYARSWRKVYKSSKAKNTQAMYDNIIEKHLSALGILKLEDITRSHYQLIISNAEGRIRTQQQIRLTFKQIIKSAIADKYLPATVLGDIFDTTDVIVYHSPEKRPLLQHEKEAIFKAKYAYHSDKAFIYILYGCGLRRGEALALTKFDFDSKRKILTIRHSIGFEGNNPYIKDTKSHNGLRKVPIPQKIFPFLDAYIKSLRSEKLFSMKSGNWITKSSYDKMWSRIVSTLQKFSEEHIDGLTAHIFRHNYCTNLCYQIPTISIKKIAELLGDTEKMVIEVYNHVMLEKENAEQAVENALNF